MVSVEPALTGVTGETGVTGVTGEMLAMSRQSSRGTSLGLLPGQPVLVVTLAAVLVVTMVGSAVLLFFELCAARPALAVVFLGVFLGVQ